MLFFRRVVVVLVVSATLCNVFTTADSSGTVEFGITKGNTDFAVDFLKRLPVKENVFFSPLSISVAFSAVNLGAGGNTATELTKALHLNGSDNTNEDFQQLSRLINGWHVNSQLLIANRLFNNKDFNVVTKYLSDVSKFYGAELQPLDFTSPASVTIINDWVANKTNQKIKDLIQKIDPGTALILVNAIYFKGQWAQKFNKSDTKKLPFHVDQNIKINVEFMNKKHKFPIFEDSVSDSKILELPYTDNDLSMYIILPNQIDGLAKLESNLRLHELLSQNFYSREIILSLPRFKFEKSIQLNSVMKSLGVKDLFIRGKADLSGIGQNLFVSEAIHKAFVEVNEEGTEAAAATAIIMKSLAMPIEQEPIIYKVDHPFLFAIVEKRSRTVLFLGRVVRPEYKGA